MCEGEMEEKEKQSSSCAVERENWRREGHKGKASGSGLRCHLRPVDFWACAATKAVFEAVVPWPVLPPKVKHVSVIWATGPEAMMTSGPKLQHRTIGP